MRIVLVEPDAGARRRVALLLRLCGIDVAAFSDSRTAFLFLLGCLSEVDGVALSHDESAPSWLLHRLAMLPSTPPVVTYSSDHPSKVARIVRGLPGVGRSLVQHTTLVNRLN